MVLCKVLIESPNVLKSRPSGPEPDAAWLLPETPRPRRRAIHTIDPPNVLKRIASKSCKNQPQPPVSNHVKRCEGPPSPPLRYPLGQPGALGLMLMQNPRFYLSNGIFKLATLRLQNFYKCHLIFPLYFPISQLWLRKPDFLSKRNYL